MKLKHKIKNLIYLFFIIINVLSCHKEPTNGKVGSISEGDLKVLHFIALNNIGMNDVIYNKIEAGDMQGALKSLRSVFSKYEKNMEFLHKIGVNTDGITASEVYKRAVALAEPEGP